MGVAPQLFFAEVMHKRHVPKVNQFRYRVYYLACPLDQLEAMDAYVPVNRRGKISFHTQDHGPHDRRDLRAWIDNILNDHGVAGDIAQVMLIAMPRILGYVFNPVSFWLCLDKEQHVRAVLCEVNNTFGETHSYLCIHDDHRPITQDDWLEAEKLFHVSPFLKREGYYRFRFAYKPEKLGIWIDYHQPDGTLQLSTSLTGTLAPMDARQMRRAFWGHPLITLKTIALIHWQALKLFSKGMRYIPKPLQRDERLSITKK